MEYEELDNMKRIQPPSLEDFVGTYVNNYQPVVIKGLFKDSPIAQIRNFDDFSGRLGGVFLNVWETLTSQFDRARTTRPTDTPMCGYHVKDYVRYLNLSGPKEVLVGHRYMPPKQVWAQFKLDRLINEMPRIDKAVSSEMFMGVPGNVTPMHFDRDNRQNLFHQVIGRKFVIIIQPEQSKKIWPIFSIASVSLHDMDVEDIKKFVRYTKASCCVLKAGETIYFPPLAWHSLHYLDNTVTVTFRFGRSRMGKFMVDAVDYFDLNWLNVCKKIIHKEWNTDDVTRDIYRTVKRAAEKKHASKLAKYYHMKKVLKDLYRAHCSESIQGMDNYDVLDRIQDNVARREIGRGYIQKHSVKTLITMEDLLASRGKIWSEIAESRK